MYHYTPLVRGERSALYDTEDAKKPQTVVLRIKIKAAVSLQQVIVVPSTALVILASDIQRAKRHAETIQIKISASQPLF